MNDISPLVLMFAMFVACILLVVACVTVWGIGHLKRMRLTRAIAQLQEILNLTNDALQTHSSERQNAVNDRIEQWDKNYSHELGLTIHQLSWT
jgi:hypothetical protein